MQKLTVKLENCYGIGTLNHTFDFSQGKVISMYAPNGAMKTSFARMFADISEGHQSKDRIFPEKKTLRSVQEDDKDITEKFVFVINSLDTAFEPKEKISTLLANQKLRNEYEKVHKEMSDKKSILLERLRELSGLSKDKVESAVSKDLAQADGRFYVAMERARGEVLDDLPKSFNDIQYAKIFNEKTIPVIESADVQADIKNYIEKYNSLIDESPLFSKEFFNHYNAETIATELKKNGFFKASHHLVFNTGEEEGEKIISEDALKEMIEREKEKIMKDEDLRKKFNIVSKKLNKNEGLRDLHKYLSKNDKILSELGNLDLFKSNLWISYLQHCKDIYDDVLNAYRKGKDELGRIQKEAGEESGRWSEVIRIYNSRFSVPFDVSIENLADTVLIDKLPNIVFYYRDPPDRKRLPKDEMLISLSAGEKRALYILNIIFEVEARKDAGMDTLFIIDDIADSFDYKNKYAILQYLKDISEYEGNESNPSNLYQIILTHNYDFYRTVNDRLYMPDGTMYEAIRCEGRVIEIHPHQHRSHPFSTWKEKVNEGTASEAEVIAFITFVRNLADYSDNKKVRKSLLQYLHIKPDTGNLTMHDLQEVLRQFYGKSFTLPKSEGGFLDFIYCAACDIQDVSDTLNLEKKIALSVAIRLKAEQFIIDNIGDNIDNIWRNQTHELISRFCKKFKDSPNAKILDMVNLMTPANIHINSFMYEPIMDMSGHHLQSLYKNVCVMKHDY